MYRLSLLFCLLLLLACNNNKKIEPETALDTGRVFIRASLDGDFKTAETYLLKDEENQQDFLAYKQYYSKMPAAQKKSYQNASYEINKYNDLNDSTTIINYANDYMKKPMEIKLVRSNNKWLVDFKYTLSGNLPIN